MASRFKSFEEMTPDDYSNVGFMCGLEVHQQLLTETKLFCRCPAGRFSPEYDAEILRHMRPTLSELGEYDGTALMEKKTKKNIYYRIHHDTVCTYEFDDTPPFLIDDQALDIGLELSLLLRLNVVDELHIARKQYLDGSIPTGFQRTGILGVTGWIPFRDHHINIRQVSIEEDACREVSDEGHDRVYLTDRLGMPLVEIVTEPDMRTPAESAAVCELIRLLCRSTGKVRTGYGAARQDVNVSVRGGTRVEIKGVPQIWRIPRLVYNEARRQWSLLQIRQELHDRGVRAGEPGFSRNDVTRLVAKVQYQPIRSAIESGSRVKCVLLKRFAGLLNTEIQEHTTFAKEFSDRIRVIACLTRLPNMVHSDTATETLSARDWKSLAKRTNATADDAMVLVWGSEGDTETACNEIVIRAREATEGIPSDTRQPLQDGTTGFERVLPGAERMYPDTDLPPLAITPQRIERLRAGLPEYVWDRRARYRKLGIPEDTIVPLLRSSRAPLFERVVNELKVDSTFAAVVLIQRFKDLRRQGLPVDRLTYDEVYDAFAAYSRKRLTRRGVLAVLEWLLRNEAPSDGNGNRVATAVQSLELGPVDEEQLRTCIAEVVQTSKSARFADPRKRYRYLMGRIMARLRERAEPGIAARLLADELGLDPQAAPGAKCETSA